MTNEELDRLMAEKVMGWKESAEGNWWKTIYINPNAIFGEIEYSMKKVYNWHPTIDIAQAMECAEQLQKPPAAFYFRLTKKYGFDGWFWLAEFNSDSRDLYYLSEANIPSLAIVKAIAKVINDRG